MSIKHKKIIYAEDGTDPNAVHPSDWNDEHILDGLLALFATLGVGPDMFPYIATDGTGQLGQISAPARNMLAQATTALILSSIGAAGLDSPAFINTPTAPTPALGLNTDQIATMAALKAMRDDLVNAAPGTLDTLKEIADAIGDDPNFAATMTAALGNRLRFDAAQSLTAGQKAQAIANLALAAVAASGAYADLTGKPTLGTAAALNVGTAASQVVQLNGGAQLPAVDGSLLTALGCVKAVKRQVFLASGTYTPSTGMLFAILEGVAGAGGGGGASANTGTYLGGGGGEGGGYARLLATAATIGASQAVTIGAGGTAGGVGGGDGGAGGDTSVGSILIAKGGAGGLGTGGAATTGGAGGAGTLAGTGDFAIRGQAGQPGMYFVPGSGSWEGHGGDGGNSMFGAGGRVIHTSGGAVSPGVAGRGYGGGGSGGVNASNASGVAGGAGASSVVVITEFCSQ